MKFLFAFIGAVIGGSAGGWAGAAVGLLAGLVIAALLPKTSPPKPADASLESRVTALEAEVAQLRAQLPRPARLDAAAHEEAIAAVETATPGLKPEREAEPEPQPEPIAVASAAVPAPIVEAQPAFIDTVARADTPPPPAAPPPPAIPLRDRLPPFISRFLFGGHTI